ncbi:hypothetical protein BDB01DRAFT_789890 [Pilobolus umbonatus]|nr:hypothetical protein BDB01DRAFT_789890 [Pilobolus umbonatus]
MGCCWSNNECEVDDQAQHENTHLFRLKRKTTDYYTFKYDNYQLKKYEEAVWKDIVNRTTNLMIDGSNSYQGCLEHEIEERQKRYSALTSTIKIKDYEHVTYDNTESPLDTLTDSKPYAGLSEFTLSWMNDQLSLIRQSKDQIKVVPEGDMIANMKTLSRRHHSYLL